VAGSCEYGNELSVSFICLAEDQLDSQEGLCYTGLVGWFVGWLVGWLVS
jgi:hypothetical protein